MTVTPMPTRRNDPRLRPITLGQLRQHSFPAREDVMEPWLRQGESAMLFAASGLGKTMVALTLALAVAGGGRVFGWTSPKPRPVIYLDGEMHIQDLRDRLVMLAPTIEGFDLEEADRNLTLIARQFQAAEVRFPDLAKDADQDVVLKEAARVEAELVVCDNFSTLCEVADENEAAAMTPVLTFLMRLKQAGRAAILIHHSDKTGSNYRGSSKLATTFEAIIGLHRLDGRAPGDGAAFELRWEKFRAKPSAATRDIEVSLEGDGEGMTWTYGPASSTEMLALLNAVRSCAFTTQDAAAASLGWKKDKVTKMKAKALGRGAITRVEWDACFSRVGGCFSDF